MDIFVPIKPPGENRITEIAPFKAVFYRAIGNDAAKLKYEAFDVMINWVEKNGFAGNGPYKLGVMYGETVVYETFCEVYYKYDIEDGLPSENGKVRIKDS